MELHGAQLYQLNEDDSNNSLLHYAANANRRDMIEYLLLKGVDINQKNKFEETPLHLCCGQNKNLALAKYLYLSGADPKLKNKLGDTALQLAQRYGNHEIALMLSQRGI